MVRSIDSRAPLVLSGCLDDLHDDLLAGLIRSVIGGCLSRPSRARARGASTPGNHDLSTCRKPFFSRPMSTNAVGREDVVHAALVDVANDRSGAADAAQVELPTSLTGSRVPDAYGAREPEAVVGWGLPAQPVPSSSATRRVLAAVDA